MRLTDYAVTYQQNEALDAASLDGYATLVKSLNDLILNAAREKLSTDDEPSDFDRLLLRSKS